MKSNNTLHIGLSCLFAVFVAAVPAARVAKADVFPCTLVPNLIGPYAAQLSGTILLPPPFDKYNGPFVRNVRLVADGNGNFQTTTVVANYGGTVFRESFTATYVVKQDGTFTISIPNLQIPSFPPGTPNVFSFDGVFFNCGNSARVILSGVSIAGQQQTNLGSVIFGTLDRQ